MIDNGTINNALTRGNKSEIVGWGMPDYSAGISIAYNETYTAPCDGLYVGACYGSGADSNAVVVVELFNESGTSLFRIGGRYNVPSRNGPASVILPIPKGYSIKVTQLGQNEVSAFYPLIGG